MSDDSKSLNPNPNPIWEWQVPSDWSAEDSRIDRAVIHALEHHLGTWNNSTSSPPPPSRNMLHNWIESEHLTLNGKATKKNHSIRPGDLIRIETPPVKPLDLQPLNIPLEILFEDSELAILNKPQGISVHPSSTESAPTLVHALLHHLTSLSSIGGVERPGIVHRLDKFTSGTMVVSKTDQAHRLLSEALQRHEIERKYWALVYGNFQPATGLSLESELRRHPTDRLKYQVGSPGKNAVSHFKVLQHFASSGKRPFMSLIECTLETGRTHQIRVHLDHLGHSIVGDPIYGKVSDRHTKMQSLPPEVRALVTRLPGQALHSISISFTHPITNALLSFKAEPPNVFSELLKFLQEHYAE